VAGWYATGVGLTIHGFYWSPGDGWHDIGPLTGYTESAAAAIDESGQIVGYSMGTLGYRAFLWTKSGGLVDLGAGVEGWSKATAISPGGVVAGTVDLGSGTGPTLPVLWITRRLP
jgi:probable HAF family extracellular repeat protein